LHQVHDLVWCLTGKINLGNIVILRMFDLKLSVLNLDLGLDRFLHEALIDECKDSHNEEHNGTNEEQMILQFISNVRLSLLWGNFIEVKLDQVILEPASTMLLIFLAMMVIVTTMFLLLITLAI